MDIDRYLWDDPATRLAIIFVGGEGCHTVLRREPMLSSRIFIWQHFMGLAPGEVLEVIGSTRGGRGCRRAGWLRRCASVGGFASDLAGSA